MSKRVDPDLLTDLKRFGDVPIEACFNCGNCTAVCPLSTDETPFPRNNIRRIQVGLKEDILHSPDPWLCYYCGDCSATCPREAEPAEAQMTLRRWLTAQYDWTGLGRLFYTSPAWEVISVLLTALLVILAFVVFHGPMVTGQVELNTFAPVGMIHLLDWIMAGLLSFFLLTNAARMYYFIIVKGTGIRIPLTLYVTEAWLLAYNFVTQERFSKCDNKRTWINHLILVSGYVTMLVLILFLLPWFQTDNLYPVWHPQRWVGYYATAALIYGAVAALWGRVKKINQIHRFSHLSDWLFPVLLLIGAITGILVHLFRYMGLPLATYTIYVFHLSMMVPMLVLEVPFGKWAHLTYRPLAIYFQRVKELAVEQQARKERLSSSGA
jgi:quinone-modifying oxidoreductase subunit QmoC